MVDGHSGANAANSEARYADPRRVISIIDPYRGEGQGCTRIHGDDAVDSVECLQQRASSGRGPYCRQRRYDAVSAGLGIVDSSISGFSSKAGLECYDRHIGMKASLTFVDV